MATDPAKIKKVATWPVLTSNREVQQFLGLANYYRRFVEKFAHIARPLHRLTKRTATFNWTYECKDAFDKLRQCLTFAPILAYPANSSWTLVPATLASVLFSPRLMMRAASESSRTAAAC